MLGTTNASASAGSGGTCTVRITGSTVPSQEGKQASTSFYILAGNNIPFYVTTSQTINTTLTVNKGEWLQIRPAGSFIAIYRNSVKLVNGWSNSYTPLGSLDVGLYASLPIPILEDLYIEISLDDSVSSSGGYPGVGINIHN